MATSGTLLKILPTSRIAFEKQIGILQAYAAASGPNTKPVNNKDVAGLLKMDPNTVSLANAFFADVGFIQKVDNGYIPVPEVISFQLAFQWNPEKAGHKLAPIIERAWFTQKLLPKFRMGPINEETAITDLAEAAAAGPEYETRVMLLLNFMEFAGIIQQDKNGLYMATEVAGTRGSTSTHESPISPKTEAQPIIKPISAMLTSTPTEGVIQFHINVKVSMAELKGWSADRITAFFSGVAQVLAAKGKIDEEE